MGFFTAWPLAYYTDNRTTALPAEGGFSLATASAMAWAAQAAYEAPDHDKLAAILTQWNWRLLRMFDQPVPGAWPRTGARGFIADTGTAWVVAIAGTEPSNLGNWLQNFDFPVDRDGAHRGFQAGALAAQPMIETALANRPGPIYLTGHSLGGALAAMTALLLPNTWTNRIAGIYTIGMPRPGNATYRDTYNPRLGDRTYRLIHADDLVPKVPPSALGFRHIGALLHCDRGNRFAGQPAIPPDEGARMDELRDIALSPFGKNTAPQFPAENRAAVRAAARLSAPIRDHLTDGYLRALTPAPKADEQSPT